MKKILTLTLATTVAAAALTGCGSSNGLSRSVISRLNEERLAGQTEQTEKPTDSTDVPDENRKIHITIEGDELDGFYGKFGKRSPISGITRHFRPTLEGRYTVEYVHTPYGEQKDETLDYDLTINDDNTYTLTVVSNGVSASHSGRWYERSRTITFFYDEQIEQPPHNYYVGDSLYCEILPKGKLMLFDNCRTIVLSRDGSDAPKSAETPKLGSDATQGERGVPAPAPATPEKQSKKD